MNIYLRNVCIDRLTPTNHTDIRKLKKKGNWPNGNKTRSFTE